MIKLLFSLVTFLLHFLKKFLFSLSHSIIINDTVSFFDSVHYFALIISFNCAIMLTSNSELIQVYDRKQKNLKINLQPTHFKKVTYTAGVFNTPRG